MTFRGVISYFDEEYNRRPTIDDLRHLLAKEERRFFWYDREHRLHALKVDELSH